MVGKTNMDQFAAGLVGTRTPFGTARNAFDERSVPAPATLAVPPKAAQYWLWQTWPTSQEPDLPTAMASRRYQVAHRWLCSRHHHQPVTVAC